MKGDQCYEVFGGIALKNHAFSFHLIEKRLNNPLTTTPKEDQHMNVIKMMIKEA